MGKIRAGRHAERHGLADLTLYRFVVAVNEIATNAVQHGGGTGRLRLWRSGDQLSCQVTDHGPGLPPGRLSELPRPPAYALDGRGLWLARHGCTTLTVHDRSTGASITLTQRAASRTGDAGGSVEADHGRR